MTIVFYIASAIAIFSTVMVVTRHNAVHALLYLVVSLVSVALIFYVLGAPFVAVLEVIIYAGAIMVLFLFVIMMLNLGEVAVQTERAWLPKTMWIGPGILSGILFALIVYTIMQGERQWAAIVVIGPQEVGRELFGPYIVAVQLAGLMLLAGLIAATLLSKRVRFKEKDKDTV
jgi:NADH-quinone oxidoreductase subunit J